MHAATESWYAGADIDGESPLAARGAPCGPSPGSSIPSRSTEVILSATSPRSRATAACWSATDVNHAPRRTAARPPSGTTSRTREWSGLVHDLAEFLHELTSLGPFGSRLWSRALAKGCRSSASLIPAAAASSRVLAPQTTLGEHAARSIDGLGPPLRRGQPTSSSIIRRFRLSSSHHPLSEAWRIQVPLRPTCQFTHACPNASCSGGFNGVRRGVDHCEIRPNPFVGFGIEHRESSPRRLKKCSPQPPT